MDRRKLFLGKKPVDAPQVRAMDTRLLSRGPLFARAEVRYTFDNDGYYILTVTLDKDSPKIHVR